MVQVQDRAKNVTYVLKQNATYPNGVCEVSRAARGPGDSGVSDGKLKTSAEFLQFDLADPTLRFDGVNVKNVRGIDCERWSRNFSIPFGPSDVSRGVVYYYFPISSWSNRGETFHRLIKRVELVGERVNGTSTRPYSHSYEFVNLVPAITNRDVFNPCYVLQMGGLGTSRAVRRGLRIVMRRLRSADAPPVADHRHRLRLRRQEARGRARGQRVLRRQDGGARTPPAVVHARPRRRRRPLHGPPRRGRGEGRRGQARAPPGAHLTYCNY